MKIVAIVQARMGSSRFPEKVMQRICGVPMIELLLKRLSVSKKIDQIILATSTADNNIPLINHVKNLNYEVFTGSENDVLHRFLHTAEQAKADIIIRITGDCPLVDSNLVDLLLDQFLSSTECDYLSNVSPPTFPDGLDVEIFTFAALKKSQEEADDAFSKEHVTPYIKSSGKFQLKNFEYEQDLSDRRWTVDEPLDLKVIESIFEYYHPNIFFGWQEVVTLQNEHPNIFVSNAHIKRNTGAKMSSGQKLWARAKQVIPGGNMLLSKRAEMFLPGTWPTYYSQAKGCEVWDLDSNKYIDMSLMGVGTNTLGYGHEEVDAAVLQAIAKGNMSTLNCPEEVYLAEELIKINPWAGMVRLARTGGEANAIAIRIARAYTGKDKVAVCGYHGWHDWYLSANLGNDDNLAGHLLSGLDPNGVPKAMRGTTFPFNYNDIDALTQLVNSHDIGVIKMEVIRNSGPIDDFLSKVRGLATAHGIILIFDECTSGFRETFGGIYQKFDVEPDMAVYSKTLGNGYAISAVVGREEVMQTAQSTFISSTFWTERIGPAAALKTLEIMKREKSWEKITAIGTQISQKWQDLADKYDLEISRWGIPALAGYSFLSENHLEYKTYVTQEMLKKGFLASTSVYSCIAHTPEIIESYFEALDPVFKVLKECEDGRDIYKLVEGPVCHAGFKRLN